MNRRHFIRSTFGALVAAPFVPTHDILGPYMLIVNDVSAGTIRPIPPFLMSGFLSVDQVRDSMDLPPFDDEDA